MPDEATTLFFVSCLLGACHTDGASPNHLYTFDLIDEDRDTWVNTHNYFRRLVAGPEAADMRLMTWNTGLEELAKTVVETCSFYHTSVRDLLTDEFSRVGENLYAGGEYIFPQMLETDGITKQWYDELAYYDYNNGTCQSGKECGHYTQVIWAETYKVGCAIARCSAIEGGNTPFLVSCNYGPAGNAYYENGVAVKPYTAGDACSQCDSGDTCDDQLCSNAVRDSNATISQVTVTSTAASTTSETTSAVWGSTPSGIVSSTNHDESDLTHSSTTTSSVTSSPEIRDRESTAPSLSRKITPNTIATAAQSTMSHLNSTSALKTTETTVTSSPTILVWGSTAPSLPRKITPNTNTTVAQSTKSHLSNTGVLGTTETTVTSSPAILLSGSTAPSLSSRIAPNKNATVAQSTNSTGVLETTETTVLPIANTSITQNTSSFSENMVSVASSNHTHVIDDVSTQSQETTTESMCSGELCTTTSDGVTNTIILPYWLLAFWLFTGI